MSKGDAKAKKAIYFEKLHSLLVNYPKIFIVEADNVGSQQMHLTRQSLRGEAEILMGKNTMVRKIIREAVDNNPDLERLLPHINGNIGFVFTKGDLKDVRAKIMAQRVAAPARAGAIAQQDICLEPHNTGQGPEKTSFFQALRINTKITRGTIEILNKVTLIAEGEKVGPSEAALLNMLGMSPFTYGLTVRTIYDSGAMFSPEILDIDEDVLLGHIRAGIANVAAVSLAVGVPTKASVTHSMVNGFKNLLGVAAATDLSFPAAEKIKEYLADPSKFAVAAAPVAAAAAPAAAAAAPVEESDESDDDMGFGLFD
ncbi:50S ribosomal protein LP0 [Fonticula alba]|uniref:60S acidic ribosomal protein P0 n=1 Tax=Fonticula alba TaxID=691883 RepID=A0A058ZB71_FONAL|nr:50S ribosomal protein LP0 [Fonticula alba]KCV71168.1 50S ribosomal protein LP0 [Fonticula alba]|eukprot:XP_009494291.1 50S ribosomal protein LP0 [Fonticula alba]